MIDKLAQQLEETKARIIEDRLLAWSSVGLSGSIAGVEVRPLTARAWIDLRLAGNPVVTTGNIEATDIYNYIWRNSHRYCTGRRVKRLKRAIMKAVKKSDDFEVYSQVLDHLRAAFSETPKACTKGGVSRSNVIEAVEGIVGAIDEVAHRYGQDPEAVCDWPLSRIFQLQKAMRLATVPDYKLLEPDSIRSIKREILINLNNGKS